MGLCLLVDQNKLCCCQKYSAVSLCHQKSLAWKLRALELQHTTQSLPLEPHSTPCSFFLFFFFNIFMGLQLNFQISQGSAVKMKAQVKAQSCFPCLLQFSDINFVIFPAPRGSGRTQRRNLQKFASVLTVHRSKASTAYVPQHFANVVVGRQKQTPRFEV